MSAAHLPQPAASARAFTCVVADDHPAIVESVSRLLEATGEIEIVGRATQGREALALIRDLRPDLALLDAQMPYLSGVEIARALAEDGWAPAIVIYSEDADPGLAAEAIAAGARGFVLKAAELAELREAVLIVAEGGKAVDAQVVAAFPDPEPRGAGQLTEREREVLRLLSDGMRNDEIAERLAISPLTVGTHVRRLMEKLQAGTRTEAVAIALRQSLIL